MGWTILAAAFLVMMSALIGAQLGSHYRQADLDIYATHRCYPNPVEAMTRDAPHCTPEQVTRYRKRNKGVPEL